MDYSFANHNTFCAFCCMVDFVLITCNIQSKLLSFSYIWDASQVEFKMTQQVPTLSYPFLFPSSKCLKSQHSLWWTLLLLQHMASWTPDSGIGPLETKCWRNFIYFWSGCIVVILYAKNCLKLTCVLWRTKEVCVHRLLKAYLHLVDTGSLNEWKITHLRQVTCIIKNIIIATILAKNTSYWFVSVDAYKHVAGTAANELEVGTVS
jgi:hypothetical protein